MPYVGGVLIAAYLQKLCFSCRKGHLQGCRQSARNTKNWLPVGSVDGRVIWQQLTTGSSFLAQQYHWIHRQCTSRWNPGSQESQQRHRYNNTSQHYRFDEGASVSALQSHYPSRPHASRLKSLAAPASFLYRFSGFTALMERAYYFAACPSGSRASTDSQVGRPLPKLRTRSRSGRLQ